MTNITKLKIASRKSKLAMWQTNYIKKLLLRHYPYLEIEIVTFVTQGDKILDQSLNKIGGKGLFIKELEQALLRQEADFSVHSMKDLPYKLNDNFCIAAIPPRADVRDCLVAHHDFFALPQHSVLATSSLRRQIQLQKLRPDLKFINIRGNLNSRLDKWHNDYCDGLILAGVGLQRLQLHKYIQQYFTLNQCLPAVGQGALAVECLAKNDKLKDLLSIIHDQDAQICIKAERDMNLHLQGNCQTPIAGYAQIQQNEVSLQAMIASEDGRKIIYADAKMALSSISDLGKIVADKLFQQGAKDVLAKYKKNFPA